ncbi:hypothetical protein BD560DRAFT_406720 [Blakeslea trispora]|nr:hypothetical protein BD560DRAFT_406720 [Blakeslea trispora]
MLPKHPQNDLRANASDSSTHVTPTDQNKDDIETGSRLSRVTTAESVKKVFKFTFDSPYFAGLLLIAAGAAIAFQAGCNATLNRYGGRAFSSVVSFSVGTACCLMFFAIDSTVGKMPLPDNRLKNAPWYAWLGGVFGAYYVIINILTVPRLGAATVLSIFVCAQIIMACIIDHFALVGVKKRPFTIWRILGCLGLIGCVVVISKF